MLFPLASILPFASVAGSSGFVSAVFASALSADGYALVVTNNRSLDPSRPDLQYADDDGAKYAPFIGKFIGVKGELTTESALSMKVVVPSDAKEVDPNTLYRTAAAQVVPPSMLPKSNVAQTE